jgi:hypothetical protein
MEDQPVSGSAAAASGAPMAAQRRRTPLLVRLRRWHGAAAPLVLAPLLITVVSGMGYRLLKDWGGFSREQVHWLMVLHEGEWLGRAGEPFYVLLNGLGLLWMLGSGALMLSQRWPQKRSSGHAAP